MSLPDTIATFVISLSSEKNRTETGNASLREAGIVFARVDAVDGRGKPATFFSEYDPRGARRFKGREMTGPEVGCYLSHLSCIEAFLQSEKQYCLVFEDDAVPAANAAKVIAETIAFIEKNPKLKVDVVNLGRAAKRITQRHALDSGFQLQQAFHFPVTTTGLLWTREGARAFLASEGTIIAPVDHALRRFCCRRGTGLALQPHLCRTSGAESTIGNKFNRSGAETHARGEPTVFEALRLGLSEARRELINYFWAARWYLASAR